MKFKYVSKRYWASLWQYLVGGSKDFSMEERAFNGISVISSVLLVVLIPFNYYIGLYPVVILLLGILAAQAFFYYYSRYKKKIKTGIALYIFLAYTLISVNFFLNSGSNGPSVLLFILAYILLIALMPKKQSLIWISVHIAVMMTLLFVEHSYPQLVPNTYNSPEARYFDIGSSYIIIIFCIYILISYIRKNYEEEKKLAEKNARAVELQNKQLERINDEKNKLFSIISHDLRSPLASIQSYMEVLSANLMNQEEKADIERQLLQLTNSTSEMLSNLLSWSKAQMQGVSVQLSSHSVTTIVDRAIQVQRTLSAKKNIDITTNIDPALRIIADNDMLQLVIRNLVNNAIKFSSPGSDIQIFSHRNEEHVEIIIKDNGVGIAPEMQPQIFTPRIPSTPGTKEEKGVGLGLLLCKEFTEMQNGRIWFHTVPGQGSSFHLSFPMSLN